MRNHIIILSVAAISAMFCSCELETSGNGDLDGMWRLVSVDTLSTGGSRDMDGTRLYWSFQNRLLQFDDKTGEHSSILCRFEHKDGVLRLYDPYVYDRENGDWALDNVQMLAPFGINSLEESCTVEKLSGGRMILRTSDLRLSFRKL